MGEVITTLGMLAVAFAFGWLSHWLRFQRCPKCRVGLPFFKR